MLLFDQSHDSSILLKTASEPVRLAALDLQKDLKRLSGKQEGFALCTETDGPCVTVQIIEGEEIEGYSIRVTEEGVTITGSDTLGCVFGIYAFSRQMLGIFPFYKLADLFPEPKESLSLPHVTLHSRPRIVRFRGWFLNDEDLLTEFKISGGKRHIDYPFYDKVMDTEVLDMILETALRLEINLIIPSSFVDIDNPDEEKLIEATARRGLYISQHHVEPLGVSYFAADNYLKRRGLQGESVSFLNNRARMEEIWRYYASKWAKYGDRVIWQLGLRGKADQSVWKADPSVPNSGRERGAIISDAIATEHRIIREALGTDCFPSTATLWMEGAELYAKGYLRLPQGTIAVFSDIGYSQTFGDDFYTTPRYENEKYGIYYHVGFWGEGPHLAEGCDLEKMADCYHAAFENKSLYYSILNVSNLRPLHLGAAFNAMCLEDPAHASVKRDLPRLLIEIAGEKEASLLESLFTAYYRTIVDLGKEELIKRCRRSEFYYSPIEEDRYPAFPATDGTLRCAGYWSLKGRQKEYTAFPALLRPSVSRWEELKEKVAECAQVLSPRIRSYVEKFLGFEISYMLHLTKWLLAVLDMLSEKNPTLRKDYGNAACKALSTILEERRVLETGSWKHWHRGDKKIGILGLLALTQAAMDEAPQA